MIKAKKICANCRKVKGLSCVCVPTKSHEGFKKNNYNLYNSKRWRKYAHQFRKDNPLCKICLEEGRTNECQMVDHIRTINSGGSIWDKSNLQALCNKCHAKKTAKDRIS